MEDDVSEVPVAGKSYYQVLTGLPPATPRQRQEEKKVVQESKKYSDDLPPSGFPTRNIQRNRNTLPKARQKAGAPEEKEYSSDVLSRTVSGEEINTQTNYSRGRGGGPQYQNTRGYHKSYRGASYESSSYISSSLPRPHGGGSRGRGQYDSPHGSLPRSQRDGKQEYGGGGGDGSYRGNYENRGRGRGRGRGYFQDQFDSQGKIGPQGQYDSQGYNVSQERVSRAPSQRRINSLQRKRQMQSENTKSLHETDTRRASSLPRTPVKRSLPNLMTNSFSSSQNVWSPDGKCPSFADILKRSAVSEETLEQNEKVDITATEMPTTYIKLDRPPLISNEEIYQQEFQEENSTIDSQSYLSTRKRFISDVFCFLFNFLHISSLVKHMLSHCHKYCKIYYR